MSVPLNLNTSLSTLLVGNPLMTPYIFRIRISQSKRRLSFQHLYCLYFANYYISRVCIQPRNSGYIFVMGGRVKALKTGPTRSQPIGKRSEEIKELLLLALTLKRYIYHLNYSFYQTKYVRYVGFVLEIYIREAGNKKNTTP